MTATSSCSNRRPKKVPGGSGESAGQRVPAWGNRKIRLGSEDGERERESPFAGLEGLETGKFSRAATFFCGAPKNPVKNRQAPENKSILFLESIFGRRRAATLQSPSAPNSAEKCSIQFRQSISGSGAYTSYEPPKAAHRLSLRDRRESPFREERPRR